MPAYEYQCQSCENRFERRQKMSEPEVGACPACGAPVKRLISGGAGTISKGSAGQSAGGRGCDMGSPCCGQDMACNAACACDN